MLLLQHSVNPPILTGGLEDFKFAFIGGGGGGWKIFKITRGRDPYVTMIYALINFGSQTSSLITQANKAKFFRSKFCKFFLLTEIWGRLTHFSVTNLLSIYDYILDK